MFILFHPEVSLHFWLLWPMVRRRCRRRRRRGAPWARKTKIVKKPQMNEFFGHVEKLDLRFLPIKTETFLVSVTHMILRFAIVQNRFEKTNKIKITISITTTSILRFLYNFGGSGLLCAVQHRRHKFLCQ